MENKRISFSPEGSIQELWSVSMPLMISILASLLMFFTDRVFLARYSTAALNASVNAGTFAWALISGFGMITAMSEVFVAHYNGSKKFLKIGIPVWQMIWFSILTFLIFVPLSIWGGELFFGGNVHQDLEIEYFSWIILFAPSYILITAIQGFFIGRGETKLLIWIALIENIVNIVLDKMLIFGVEGWIPKMGIKGAAIATCIGYCLEAVVLTYLFLKKKNREYYGTSNYQLNLPEMGKCLKIGIPQGVFYTMEVLGWSLFYFMMTSLSVRHITISSICQSITLLLFFFCESLSRASTTIVGNLIGAQKDAVVIKVLRSGITLLFFFTLTTSCIFLFDTVSIVKFIFSENISGIIGNELGFEESLKLCLLFSFFYLFFDGLRWLTCGFLIAAGDTFFLLIFGSMSVWIFLLAPVYLIVVKNRLSVEYAWAITMTYSILAFSIYLYRFLQGKWKQTNFLEK